MEREEVEFLPSGLATCLINSSEMRIMKIAPNRLTFRAAEKIENIQEIKIAFYLFEEYRYEELIIKDYLIEEIKSEEFYCTYTILIQDELYFRSVRNTFKNYQKYIMDKAFGDGNDFSNEMVNYPAEDDYDFYGDYLEQKKEWLSGVNYAKYAEEYLERIDMAVNLDNFELYSMYLNNDLLSFKDEYFKKNYLDKHVLFQKDISRIYIGNEFCHNLFPSINQLMDLLNKAKKEKLQITLAFTYMRECYINRINEILDKAAKWCDDEQTIIEIVINDWGMLELLKGKSKRFKISLGVLLNKRKKDPRYAYKKGYEENKGLMAENSLNSGFYQKFLRDNNIERYEYESCGYQIKVAEGAHSLHLPFYQTNTSQYCTLYAMCTNMDRGKQKLVKECPKYCNEYVLTYPKHLKMIGRYNSLFAFDDTLLRDFKALEYYINNGIDRIVLNLI